ncbi:Hypothetical protein, putative [Bodo saltans]|nr:Hypothetical protein, putative [Bodo saltans]|eukprot:CUF41025.1 Hypothetical protein, putative [Bodo saltans]
MEVATECIKSITAAWDSWSDILISAQGNSCSQSPSPATAGVSATGGDTKTRSHSSMHPTILKMVRIFVDGSCERARNRSPSPSASPQKDSSPQSAARVFPTADPSIVAMLHDVGSLLFHLEFDELGVDGRLIRACLVDPETKKQAITLPSVPLAPSVIRSLANKYGVLKEEEDCSMIHRPDTPESTTLRIFLRSLLVMAVAEIPEGAHIIAASPSPSKMPAHVPLPPTGPLKSAAPRRLLFPDDDEALPLSETELADQQAAELAAKQAADLAAKQAAELAAQQAAELAAKQAADLADQQAAELAAKQAAELAAKQAAELATQQAADLAAKQAAKDAAAQELHKRKLEESTARRVADLVKSTKSAPPPRAAAVEKAVPLDPQVLRNATSEPFQRRMRCATAAPTKTSFQNQSVSQKNVVEDLITEIGSGAQNRLLANFFASGRLRLGTLVSWVDEPQLSRILDEVVKSALLDSGRSVAQQMVCLDLIGCTQVDTTKVCDALCRVVASCPKLRHVLYHTDGLVDSAPLTALDVAIHNRSLDNAVQHAALSIRSRMSPTVSRPLSNVVDLSHLGLEDRHVDILCSALEEYFAYLWQHDTADTSTSQPPIRKLLLIGNSISNVGANKLLSALLSSPRSTIVAVNLSENVAISSEMMAKISAASIAKTQNLILS